MTDPGLLHTKSRDYGKCPEEVMHNLKLTDGAVRQYCHMHWRYGSNQKNFEGLESMADALGISEATAAKRIKELEAADWVVVIERPNKGSFTTNFYHVFEDQADAIAFRKSPVIGEGEQVRAKSEVKKRKSRKGVGRNGGNPALNPAKVEGTPDERTNSSLDGEKASNFTPRPNSSLDERTNSSLDERTNSSLSYPESVYPDSVYPENTYAPEVAWGQRISELVREHLAAQPPAETETPTPAFKKPLKGSRKLGKTPPPGSAAPPSQVDEKQGAEEEAPKSDQQSMFGVVAKHIFGLEDPSVLPDKSRSTTGAIARTIREMFESKFGTYHRDTAEYTVGHFVRWCKSKKDQHVPKYKTTFAEPYARYLQTYDNDIRRRMEQGNQTEAATSTPQISEEDQRKIDAKWAELRKKGVSNRPNVAERQHLS